MAKKNILIVDDVENILFSIKTQLELKGYNVKTASSGKNAIKEIKKKKPDLVILDIMMPEMDGWEVAKEIKEKLNLKIPLLFLTARTDKNTEKLSKTTYKAEGFLTKPCLQEDLLREIKKLI